MHYCPNKKFICSEAIRSFYGGVATPTFVTLNLFQGLSILTDNKTDLVCKYAQPNSSPMGDSSVSHLSREELKRGFEPSSDVGKDNYLGQIFGNIYIVIKFYYILAYFALRIYDYHICYLLLIIFFN